MATASKPEASPPMSIAPGDQARRAIASEDSSFLFGPFRLLPGQRQLEQNGRVVQLGSRACEILIALVERAGELVDKRELMARAWPSTTVVEANLRTQMNGLRRVLAEGGAGDSYVATIPGRGYRFIVPVDRTASTAPHLTLVLLNLL
jgi:DNA-binding winged helix-turn-helix (wHTH) protein